MKTRASLRSFEEVTVEHFRRHPHEIPLYLDIAFRESKEDGNWEAFMLALRIAVEAKDGMTETARRLGKSRPSLYKTLSGKGNPKLDTVESILRSVGCRLTIEPSHGSANP